jgi:ribonuclease E
MTFTEAAVEVLKREGKPLHFRKIAEIAIHESLLDHVGKIPEDTMADQLAAHCKLPRSERAIVVVQHATFALEDWGLPEDPLGLENLVELPPAGEPAYRPRERHPIPTRELSRSSGRDAGRDAGRESGRGRRREEVDEKKRRYPPPAEVAYEILSGADRPLTLRELASLGAERMLMPDAFVRDTASLAAALLEDNRRRESAGRKSLFSIDGESIVLGAAPEPGDRPAPVSAARALASPAEMRRSALAALRRRLRECDGATIEHLVERLLEKDGMLEVKVAKRGRESVVLTGRKRMGLVEVRHAIRVLRTGGDIGRRDVADVRRDLGHYGAQIGVLVSSGEAQRDARAEASAAGQMPVLLIAGEAFAEAFADAGVGCRIVSIPEADEEFLAAATETAQREETARKARREERDRREGREGREERDDSPALERGSEQGPVQGRGRGRDRDRIRDRERHEERRPRPEPVVATSDEVVEIASIAVYPAPPIEERPSGEEPATPTAPVALLPAAETARPEPISEDDDADGGGDGDGDDEGDDDGTPAAQASEGAPGEAPKDGAAGEARRRRRRRRRRGGRGRGERRPDGAAAPQGAEGSAPQPPSPPSGDAPPRGSGEET